MTQQEWVPICPLRCKVKGSWLVRMRQVATYSSFCTSPARGVFQTTPQLGKKTRAQLVRERERPSLEGPSRPPFSSLVTSLILIPLYSLTATSRGKKPISSSHHQAVGDAQLLRHRPRGLYLNEKRAGNFHLLCRRATRFSESQRTPYECSSVSVFDVAGREGILLLWALQVALPHSNKHITKDLKGKDGKGNGAIHRRKKCVLLGFYIDN